MSIQPLTQIIRYEFETKNFISRLHASIKAISNEHGKATAGVAITALSVSSVAGAALCWLTMEGSVRSIIDVIEDQRPIVRLRYLGDAGGWTSLALFTVVAVKGIFEKILHEGEYIQFKDIATNWLADKAEAEKEALYPKICVILDELASRGLFTKYAAAKHALAIELCNPAVESRLQPIFENITKELQQELLSKKYCCRMMRGGRSIKSRGCSPTLTARIFGIVFPILLMVNFALSIVGEVGLGTELFGLREDLTAIGHFGEWPINAIEALATAYLFNLWYTVLEANVNTVKSVYQSHLVDVAPELEASYREVAKEELAQQGATSSYLQLDQELDELTDRFEHL